MKKYKKEFSLSSFENLIVSLYVIGYKNIGESIIVLFRDVTEEKDDPVFSFVVDCYKSYDLFITKRILDDHNIKKLDFVCWTHPHADHSPGIDEIIQDYFSEDMWIFMPKFYFGNLCKDILKSESINTQEVYDNINSIIEKSENRLQIRKTITGEGDMTNQYLIKMVDDRNLSKELSFNFFTPFSGLIDKYTIPGNVFSTPNSLSISFVMSIDGYDFFFGGDTEGKHLECIDKQIVQDMRWIKVPHHCSLGGKFICDNLGMRFDCAASTVYKSSGLPKQLIQEEYKKNGRLFMTQLDNEPLNQDYGVIEFDYRFRQTDILVDIHTYGNAHEYIA